MHPADRARLEKEYESYENLDIEYRIVRVDGAVRHVHEITEGIKDESGRVIRSLCILQDITARKNSEEELKESERKRSIWLESSPACTKVIDLDLNLQYMSQAGVSGLGIDDVTTLYGKPYPFGFFPESFKKTMTANMKEAIDTGEINALEAPVLDLRGNVLWFHSTVIPVNDEQGKIDYLMVVSINTTERRQAEELSRKFSQIVSSSSDVLALLNSELVYEATNAAYLQKFSKDDEPLIGKSLADVFEEELYKTVIKPNAERCLRGETAQYKVWINCPGIGTRFMDVVYSPYTDLEGQIQGIVVGGRDVTEQHRMEEELFKARNLESVGVLAGGIAHDFNNILSGLFGNIELAKRELTQNDEAYSYIETASMALARATDLTKQLLTFSKGSNPLLESVDLEQLIQNSVRFSLSGSNVKASVHLAEDLLQVKADQGQLSQVLANLTINAVQAMPDGGALTIEAKNIDDIAIEAAPNLSGSFVVLTICDEGLGISPKHIDKIFDLYFSTKQSGSGLGLASVHSIILRHNGYISVDSELGVGTCFTIYLPAEVNSQKPIDKPSSNETELSVSAMGHILLMDDDEMVRDFSSTMLKSFGYRVDTATDGVAAIEQYIAAEKNGEPFDAAIIDLTIPGGMGGKEMVEKLLEIDPQAKMIVCSGYSTDPILADYTEYGFKGRLVKPFLMADLEAELSRVLNA